MRQKNSFLSYFKYIPLVVAVCILSAPIITTGVIQRILNASCTSIFTGKNRQESQKTIFQKLPEQDKAPFIAWSTERAEIKMEAIEKAKKILPEIGKTEALVAEVIARPLNYFS